MRTNARKIAYELLFSWEKDKTFPNLALKNALRAVEDQRDRRFITALVYGVVEKKITLDHFLNQCLTNQRLEPTARCILRMGLYQMFYMDTPSAAACDTSVELTKQLGLHRYTGLVNAVLRRCDRERETMLLLKKADFSVRYSISPVLVDLLLEQYGKENFVSIMEGIQQVDSSIYLYHNHKKGTAKSFVDLMRTEGIDLQETEIPHLYRSLNGFSPEHSTAYKAGLYHIVSPHSAEAASLLPSESETILDLCAAPGGKTFILAANTHQTVYSFDIHSHKVRLLEQEATRLGHTNVVATLNDGTVPMTQWQQKADFVLCDVPCSGLGMMGKKPDIKYKEYDSFYFTAIQTSILENGALYLKNGGRLVYSTCTIDRRENEELIKSFLNNHPQFALDDTVLDRGEKRYLPGVGSDGFYIAVLKRVCELETGY